MTIINGTYKKDKPDENIGYQKFKKVQTYIVTTELYATAKTLEEAIKLFDKVNIKVEPIDEYGETFRESVEADRGDISIERYTDADDEDIQKVEECVPLEEEDFDTGERYLNYEIGDWTKNDFEFRKNPDGSDIKQD